jgi:4a-hydroxytetrahydrobiopterin dehydratase
VKYQRLTAEEFAGYRTLDDWRFVLRTIQATFRASSFAAATELVAAISAAADRADHHPDIELRYPGRVHVTLSTHAVGGITTRDTDLAREISQLAAERGAVAVPTVAQEIEIAIDAIDIARIRPFWKAVLGYEEIAGDLVDPLRQGPPVWFQQMDEQRPQRNRIHVDVSVPHDAAKKRVADALKAGGTLVSAERANAFWVLADAEGNEACVCTWQDR